MKSPRFVAFPLVFLFVIGGQVKLAAQTLTGTVTDPSGAAIPGATITVKSEKTGEERIVKSNDAGTYRVGNLAPASYSIEGKSPSLGPTQNANIPVVVGQERVVNLILQPAALNQEVTVSSGELVTIDTSSASIGANVNEREVASL